MANVPKDFYDTVPDLIKFMRIKKGITQVETARITGISVHIIQNYELRRTKLDVQTANLIIQKININKDDISDFYSTFDWGKFYDEQERRRKARRTFGVYGTL